MTSVRPTVLLTLAWLAAAGTARAADSGTGWHIVRPGENMHQIAARYLGSTSRWPELARLNPEVQDPNRLEPGQRIRVAIPGAADTAAARVARVSRKVETQPTPIAWEETRQGDLLLDRDGLRTFPKSSAEMAFTDGTRLLVTESSLVFLQKAGGQLRGVDRNSVEIVEGQADVEARPAAGRSRPPAEVEIVLGTARATARPAPAGGTRTRARRPEGGGAKLMVYGGEGEIEAGGAKVTVPEGMGSSVAAEGPPSPPEKLLPSPQAVAPPAGSQVECANPRFSWTGVPEAASYTVEVCHDASCAALADRAAALPEPAWRPAALPKGDYYWRVTARSGSGLDGYPSEPVRLAITSDQADLQGPRETPEIAGPQLVVGDALWAGPTARVIVRSFDPETGDPVVREVTRTPEELAAFAAGTATGGGLGGASADRCGNAASLQPFAFTVDAAAPELTWEVVDLDEFPNKRRGARTPDGLSWSGGARWMALEASPEPVTILSDAPQLLLHGASFDVGDEEADPGRDQMLRVRIHDAGAGVHHLTFQLRDRTLEIEAVDMVGNSRKLSWPLNGPQSRKG